MASKFGAPFVQSSFEPLRAAASKLADGHLSEGLEALARDKLERGYQQGIDATALAFRVPRNLVERALPSPHVQQVLDEVGQRQSDARRSVGQFVGTIGSLLPGSGGPQEPASQRLQTVADKYALDEHINQPVSALSESIARWEALLEQAGAALTSDPSLRAVVVRRRWTWTGIVLLAVVVVGCSAGVGVWHHVVVTGAQERVAALIAGSDPCVGERAEAGDLEHALPAQLERLEQMKGACAKKREREAYLASCAALADHLEAGALSGEDEPVAQSAHALLERVAAGTLGPKDLTIGPDVMPCEDTPSHERLWATYTKRVASSVELWGKVDAISPHVRKLLTAKGGGLSDRARETLQFRVESQTKLAITKGLEPGLERARRLCALVDQLGYPKEPWCKALDRITKREEP